MSRLLGTYQLWLDDLFPKAKFLDGLAMIEKLGHKKKIQIYRKEWIDDGKPRNFEDDLDDFLASRRERTPEQLATDQTAEGAREPEENEVEMQDASTDNHVSTAPNGLPRDALDSDEDDLDALLNEASMDESPAVTRTLPQPDGGHDEPEPDEDELDALLAEDTHSDVDKRSLFGGPESLKNAPAQKPPNNDFADEEEAMAGMDW